ncbi:MAG: hypothetical protein HZA34_00805 [Candidatus Pacebacteria bacterium]|nr:hypothetical protein [Candidatus Paceibacterota bacterium]
MKKIMFFTLVVSILLFPKSLSAQDQQKTSLSISPPLSEIVIQPGKSVTQAFNITNEGSVNLEVIPTVVPFAPHPETGEPVLLLNSTRFPFATLQNLDKALDKPFLLKAKQSDQLVLRIAIPEKEKEKDYYVTLLLQTKPSGLTQLNETGSISQAYLGVHLLVSVSKSGEDKGNLTIHQFKSAKFLDTFSDISPKLFVKNNGTTFTKAHGEIKIISLTGEIIKLFPILPENVLSGGVRELHTSLPDPEDAKSAIPAPFTYKPLFLLGSYTVTARVFAENQIAEEVTIQVFAFPFSLVAFIISLYFTRHVIVSVREKRETKAKVVDRISKE